MTSTADRVVDDYLARLEAELGDLPRGDRRELLREISAHVAAGREELGGGSEAEVRTLLDRLGDPADIAADARERFGVHPHGGTWREIAALVLLLVGGIVLPVIGWVIGVVLLWASDAWTTREKVLGTLVLPGGLALPLFLGTFAASGEVCSGAIDPATGEEIPGSRVCTGGPSAFMEVAGPILFVASILAPIAMAIFLARRMRRVPAEA